MMKVMVSVRSFWQPWPCIGLKGGAAPLHSWGQQKPSATYPLDREKSYPLKPVAQRTSRVAKQLAQCISIQRLIEGFQGLQKEPFSKSVFFGLFLFEKAQSFLARN